MNIYNHKLRFISLFIIFFIIRFSNLNISERVFLNGGEDISRLSTIRHSTWVFFQDMFLVKIMRDTYDTAISANVNSNILFGVFFFVIISPQKMTELARKANMIEVS